MLRRWRIIAIIALLVTIVHTMSQNENNMWRDTVKEMFMHAYNSYMKNAFPQDELRPLSCTGMTTWGNYSLTLVDALDSLLVLGEKQEFVNGARFVIDNLRFDYNLTVSLFETNIRILGGLLSAHLLLKNRILKDTQVDLLGLEAYDDELLKQAIELGDRLLVAFDTETGVPYGMVNFKYGVMPNESSITSTAGAGTFLIEFGMLSVLTGDVKYLKAAKRASRALFDLRSTTLGLVGNHINIQTGIWTHRDASIGASVDSYYEYLFKSFQLFHDHESLHEFTISYDSILKYLYFSPWYFQVDMITGQTTWPLFNSLQSFWPGIQAQFGHHIREASDTLIAFHSIWRRFGVVPEGFNILGGFVQPNEKGYPLRPELAESIYYLYRVTRDPMYKMMGRDMVKGLQMNCRTDCGFANIKDVETLEKDDRMESFFLSETLKYLYLLYDDENFVNNCQPGDEIEGYVMNTEAHLMPITEEYILKYKKLMKKIDRLDGKVRKTKVREFLKRQDFRSPVPEFFSQQRYGVCQLTLRNKLI